MIQKAVVMLITALAVVGWTAGAAGAAPANIEPMDNPVPIVGIEPMDNPIIWAFG